MRTPAEPPTLGASLHYGADLAAVHHAHFGQVARAAAGELLARLRRAGRDSGLVVDLAAGSGVLARAVADAGFRVHGVDLSPAMINLARSLVPEARWTVGSLWEVMLPAGEAAAVTAVGEAFSYAADPVAGLEALTRRLANVHRALEPGGLLLFDVAGPGRSGPERRRRRTFEHTDAVVLLDEREDAAAGALVRQITAFRRVGELFRRTEETHRLWTCPPDEVGAALAAAGFAWELLEGYGELELLPGWHAFVATKG